MLCAASTKIGWRISPTLCYSIHQMKPMCAVPFFCFNTHATKDGLATKSNHGAIMTDQEPARKTPYAQRRFATLQPLPHYAINPLFTTGQTPAIANNHILHLFRIIVF
jgi:hypothetical protein